VLIDKVLNKDPAYAWKAVSAIEGVLVSHAGISSRYEEVFRETCHEKVASFAEHLNREFREAVRRRLETPQEDAMRVSISVGGDAALGEALFGEEGPFWFRPPPYSHSQPLGGVRQVAGHSPPVEELQEQGFYMIDPAVFLAEFGEPLCFRYAVIEEGRVRVEQGPLSLL
jgi:hypothetical protein